MSLYTQSFDQLPISPSPPPKSKLINLTRSNTISELINLNPSNNNLNSLESIKNLKNIIQCEIHLAKEMACLGEMGKSRAIIQGIVKLDLLKDITINEFNINIIGECKFSKLNLFNKSCNNSFEFLNFSKVIVDGQGKGLRFCERQYYIPFEYLIIDELPSTYSSSKVKLTYSIQLNIKSSDYQPLVISRPFKLIRCWLNPNYFDLQSSSSSLTSSSSSFSSLSFPTEQIIQTSNNLLIKLSAPRLIFPNEKYANIKIELEKFRESDRGAFPKFIKFSLIQVTRIIRGFDNNSDNNSDSDISVKTKKYLIRNLNLNSNSTDSTIRLDTLLWIFKTPKIRFSLNSNFLKVEHLLKIEFNWPLYRNKSIEIRIPIQLQAYPKNLLELGSPPTYVPPPKYSI